MEAYWKHFSVLKKILLLSARISKMASGRVVCREKLLLLRIYIKRQSDFKIVRQICEKYFPGIPAIYVEADVCRDDLLVEIEAEALLER